MKIAQRAVRAQPFHAMSIGARARALESRGIRIAKLSLGEPSFGAPPGVHEAMRATMDGRALPYTPAAGLPALRRAVAGLYRTRHGVDVDPRRVLITAGASAGLLLATALTTEAGDDVVMADPCYPCNRELVDTFGGRVVLAPTTPAARCPTGPRCRSASARVPIHRARSPSSSRHRWATSEATSWSDPGT